jgi:hypothetical protein
MTPTAVRIGLLDLEETTSERPFAGVDLRAQKSIFFTERQVAVMLNSSTS